MAAVIITPPVLSGELTLFHTTDPLLANSPVLVFYGPASTLGATSSRIQLHILTPAGLCSYSRLSVSPNSPFYSVVKNLPREEQGDEICRGIAFGLKRYFAELSDGVKKAWCAQVKAPAATALFGDEHIAILATRMSKLDIADDVIADITEAFGEQKLSWLDIDVVLPPGSIHQPPTRSDSPQVDSVDDGQLLQQMYGKYANIISAFGAVAFLPTSKLRRAPSKATALGRSASFLKQQKDNVLKEIGELVNTEENYVDRLLELNALAVELRANCQTCSDERLATLFPASIAQIEKANAEFLYDLRAIHSRTEPASTDDIATSQQAGQDQTTDLQAVHALAKSLCHWFPQLAECYGNYLQEHAKASQLARSILREESALAARLREKGEQKLTSLLIEPIQRLPRYNLYIDGIVKQLPVRHPAIKPLLKARDLITEICADDEGTGAVKAFEKLRSRVSGWPVDSTIHGRLITAVDYVEMVPPYSSDRCNGNLGILLLFTDGVTLLSKSLHSRLSARTLLTEIESNVLTTKPDEAAATTTDLQFLRRVQLDALLCTESHNGNALHLYTYFHLTAASANTQAATMDSCTVLWLQNAYEGKAARFCEELTKAKVEGRFSEAERQSTAWEFRATDAIPDNLGLFTAVFEESNPEFSAARKNTPPARILLDAENHLEILRAGEKGIRTVIALSHGNDGSWCITVDSIDGTFGREYVDFNAVVPSIRKKLATLTSVRLSIEQPAMTATLLERNTEILRSIELVDLSKDEEFEKPQLAPREKFHRPRSPRKLISSLLSSVGSGSEPPSAIKRDLPSLSNLSQIPRMQPPMQKPPSRESRPSSKEHATPLSTSSWRSVEDLAPSSKRLEDTLSAYVLALQARKGNIVGKNLKARKTADELAVNELYNSLLEDPNTILLAAQAPVDVLFAAFEKFLNNAWKEQLGNLIPYSILHEIQSKAETMFPVDFDEYFRNTLAELTPQNQRAFQAIVRLLADLLDGTGNDSDRGILTAAFAEVLVTDGNPHDYIALIDRFVDDTDTYFGEPYEEVHKLKEASHKRSRSVNSSSITSNTSSLRKKFGFGSISRDSSKFEQESKVASVWRTLSKNSRSDTGTTRSQTTDIDSSWHSSRPSSRDGPKMLQAGDLPTIGHAPSSHNLGLTTIGEHPSFIPTGPPKKKRRSSLSDLQALDASHLREGLVTPTVRHPLLTQIHTISEKGLYTSPLPTSSPSKGQMGSVHTPAKLSPRSRLPSSFRREESPGTEKMLNGARPKSSGGKSEEVIMSVKPTTSIPSLTPRSSASHKRPTVSPERNGLAERHGAGNIVKKPSPQAEKMVRPKSSNVSQTTPSLPKKLRMQSPQKLRERLHNEQNALIATQDSFQNELSKIGDELTSAAASNRAGSSRGSGSVSRASGLHSHSSMDLAQRVLKMEGRLPTQIDELRQRISTIQADLSSSLSVSESKCKKLDELYRDANGENEALYARFNDELSRILKAVRGGDGVEELRKQLKESQEEAAKLRRETSRLKRENVGLRAQLKD